MDVVITINEKDILKNPSILDAVKGFAAGLAVEPETLGMRPAPAEPMREEAAQTPAPQEEPAPTEPEPMAEEGAEITVSIEEVRGAIAKVSKKHGTAAAKKILQDHGAETLSGLDPKFYAAAKKEAEEAL